MATDDIRIRLAEIGRDLKEIGRWRDEMDKLELPVLRRIVTDQEKDIDRVLSDFAAMQHRVEKALGRINRIATSILVGIILAGFGSIITLVVTR